MAPAAQVHDDGVKDVLTGSEGLDWFFANLDGDNDSAKDPAHDKAKPRQHSARDKLNGDQLLRQ